MATINKLFGLILLLALASVAEFGMAKRCTLGEGECGERICCDGGICGDSCCDCKCKAKYGSDNGQGYCNRIASHNLCYCEFDC